MQSKNFRLSAEQQTQIALALSFTLDHMDAHSPPAEGDFDTDILENLMWDFPVPDSGSEDPEAA